MVALRWAIGLLFVYAGVSKAMDFEGFQKAIFSYRLMSYGAASAAAIYLPWLEIACGVCVLTRRVYAAALLILFLLMVLFTIVLVVAWIRGIDITCGCFGGNRPVSSYAWLLVRDVAMAVAVYALRVEERRASRMASTG